MKSSNNWRDRVLTCHLLSSNKASCIKTGSHLTEFLGKGATYEFPNNLGYCQDYSLLNYGPIAEDNTYTLIEC